MKRAIILLLAFVLLVGTMTVPVSASEATEEPNTEIADWSYDNSILVTVTTAEDKVFTPEDFPEVECIRIMHLQKYIEENEYVYELMLQFDDSTFDFDATKEKLLSMDGVLTADRNNYDYNNYEKKESFIKLNETVVYLPIGRSVELFITDYKLVSILTLTSIYIEFSPSSYEEIYSLEQGYKGRVWSRLWEIDAEQCRGKIRETKDDPVLWVDLLDVLSKIEGVHTINVKRSPECGGRDSEAWSVSDAAVVEMQLSGGVQPEMSLTPLLQTATIVGKSVGSVEVFVVHDEYYESEKCTIHVYVPADANDDGEVDSLDAAAILKHDAGVAQLTEDQLEECDMNGDGEVDSLDAVLLLKYDAGMYN